MKKWALAMIPCLGLVTFISANAAEVTPKSIAAKAIGQLGQEMRKKLTDSLQKNGPAGAIDVCAKDAPIISARIDQEQGVTIKRTSLKVRNPQNAPDSAEKELLETLESYRSTKGALPTGVTAFPNNQHRFYKAIVMEQACLKCHGDSTTITEQVRKEITATYPDDKALGYKEGDLRGIISVLVK